MNQRESLDISRVTLSPTPSQDNAVVRAVSLPGSKTDKTVVNTEESSLSSANSDTKDIMVVDVEAVKPANGMAHNGDEEIPEAQAGVKNMEAMTMSWTRWGLIIAYASLFAVAFTTSLEGQVGSTLAVFATSSFSQHSLISTVYVVQGVVNAVIKPPMAKVADVFGRLEAFSISILLLVLGYMQMATSTNVQRFGAAQLFYSAGGTGLQILQQIFIADTSSLMNRGLLSTMPAVPYMVNVWIGSLVGGVILKTIGWRWGYGMWCIILPAMFIPFALTMFLNNRKAQKQGLTTTSSFKGLNFVDGLKNLWVELDIGGTILLTAAFALILLPLTIASKTPKGWGSPSIISMLVLGVLCLVAFPFWESNKKLSPRPLVPLHLLKSRTFCCGCAIGFLYFMAFYLSIQPYFYSYLLVVQKQPVTAAGHIVQSFSFTATIASIIVSLIIKYTKVYKPFVCAGALFYIAGLGLMIRFRDQEASTLQIIGTQIGVGIGGGIFNVATQLGVQASADHGSVAVATAVFMTAAELGGAAGSALAGAVWSRSIPAKLQLYLPKATKPLAMGIFNDITKAISYEVGSAERLAIDRSYQEAMRTLLILAICVAAPLIPLSLAMKNISLEKKEDNSDIGAEVEGREEPTTEEVTRKFWEILTKGGHLGAWVW